MLILSHEIVSLVLLSPSFSLFLYEMYFPLSLIYLLKENAVFFYVLFFLLARASVKINSGLTVCLTTRQLNIVHVIYFSGWNMMEVKPDFILSQHFRFWFFLSRQRNRFVFEIYTDKNQLVLFLKSTSTNVF